MNPRATVACPRAIIIGIDRGDARDATRRRSLPLPSLPPSANTRCVASSSGDAAVDARDKMRAIFVRRAASAEKRRGVTREQRQTREGDKLAIFAGCLGITLHKNKIWITELSHHISESDHIYYVGPCGWDPFWTLSRADVTIYQDRRTTLYQILKYTYTYVRNTVSTKARTRSRGRTLFSIENPPLRSAPARADGRRLRATTAAAAVATIA